MANNLILKMVSYTFHSSQLPRLECGFTNMLAILVNYRDNILPIQIDLKISHTAECINIVNQYLESYKKYSQLPWWRRIVTRQPAIPHLQRDNTELLLGVDRAISRLEDKLTHIQRARNTDSEYYLLISATDDTVEHAIINGKYTNFTVADIIKRL